MVLQPGQAAQCQQQQILTQQVVHHPQPQQAGHPQQTSTSTPQVGAQSISVGNSPQVASQLKQVHLQQQLLHQQQQQQVWELHLKLITLSVTFMCCFVMVDEEMLLDVVDCFRFVPDGA